MNIKVKYFNIIIDIICKLNSILYTHYIQDYNEYYI